MHRLVDCFYRVRFTNDSEALDAGAAIEEAIVASQRAVAALEERRVVVLYDRDTLFLSPDGFEVLRFLKPEAKAAGPEIARVDLPRDLTVLRADSRHYRKG